MSTSRIPADAGHCDRAALPKGPRGHALCRQCGVETQNKRTTFCDDPECVKRWRLRTSPSLQREAVWKRDSGVCALCRVDTVAQRNELLAMGAAEVAELAPACAIVELDQYSRRAIWWKASWKTGHDIYRVEELPRTRAALEAVALLAVQQRLYTGPVWDMDHIVPVVEGGGARVAAETTDPLENLRTLCRKCHVAETAALRARLAEKRKASR